MIFLLDAGSVWDGADDAVFFAAVLALVTLVVVGSGITVVALDLVALVVVVDLLAILLRGIQNFELGHASAFARNATASRSHGRLSNT